MERLEAAFEVVEGRLGVSDNGRFFGEVEGSLRIVVIFRTRADDICIWGGGSAGRSPVRSVFRLQ